MSEEKKLNDEMGLNINQEINFGDGEGETFGEDISFLEEDLEEENDTESTEPKNNGKSSEKEETNDTSETNSDGNNDTPFGDTSFLDEEVPEEKKKNNEKSKNAQGEKTKNPGTNIIENAMNEVIEKETVSIFAKPAIFKYGAVTEAIEEPSMTFEALRIKVSDDFPELEDGKRVSWTVTYGKIKEKVADPKKATIQEIKQKIETSKEFLDSLKKVKDKNPNCEITPSVVAQSKGTLPIYKGIYSSYSEALKDDKIISIFPGEDKKIYEMRRNEIGTFITETNVSACKNVDKRIMQKLLSYNNEESVDAGFTPALPLIPCSVLMQIFHFFKNFASLGYEVMVQIYWDKEQQQYIVDIPEQYVTEASIKCTVSEDFQNDRYIHYMDIHSHGTMNAFFSSIDDSDEKATRVYAVVGNNNKYFPDLKVRISNGGNYLEINPNTVFESYIDSFDYPDTWDINKITLSPNTPTIEIKCENKNNWANALCEFYAYIKEILDSNLPKDIHTQVGVGQNTKEGELNEIFKK